MPSIQTDVASPVISEKKPHATAPAIDDRQPLDAVGREPDRHREQQPGDARERDDREDALRC